MSISKESKEELNKKVKSLMSDKKHIDNDIIILKAKLQSLERESYNIKAIKDKLEIDING